MTQDSAALGPQPVVHPARPRVGPVADPPGDVREWLERSLTHDGQPLNIFRTIAHHPQLLRRFVSFGAVLLNQGRLRPRDRELVILRVAVNCRCEYEFGQHARLGREAGLSRGEIDALVVPTAGAAEWSADDRQLIDATDELCSTDSITAHTWATLAERFTQAELVELVLLVGYYRMTAALLNALDVERETGVSGWPRHGGWRR